MGKFKRENLPDPISYFENRGHTLFGNSGKQFRTDCTIHGGKSSNLSVLRESGAFFCFSCGAKGGDVLSYEMQDTGCDFVTAARALGAWVDDGHAPIKYKPSPLTPRQALLVLAFESTLAAVSASNVGNGVVMSQTDRARLLNAASRINQIAEAFQ
jgi:hypothetical protein